MSGIFYQSLNFSLKNIPKTGVVYKKNYSALCGCYKINNHEKNKKIKKSHNRQFSFKSAVNDGFSIFDKFLRSDGCLYLKDLLIKTQESTGLPWWATIILASSVVRFSIILPAVIYKEKVNVMYAVKRRDCEIKIKDIEKEALALAKKNNLPLEKTVDMIRKKNRKLLKDVNDWKLIGNSATVAVTGLQACIWMAFTGTLRNLTSVSAAEAPKLVNQLSQGGFYSFHNLLIPDSYFVLPIIFGTSSLVLIEYVYLKHMKTQLPSVTYTPRLLAIGAAVVSSVMPSGITLYWTASIMGAFVQNIVVMCPRLLRICKIENLTHETNPYKVIWERFKFQWGLIYDKKLVN